MPRPSKRPRWATLAEAETYSKVKSRTLRSWIDAGLLPGYKVGPRGVQVDLNDLDALRRRIPAAASVLADSEAV